MFIFLDESGDLGFDWSKPGTSRYFTITLLVCSSTKITNDFKQAIKRTLRNKLNHKKSGRKIYELKGTNTTLEIKQYFYKHAPKSGWHIYSVTLNKKRVLERLQTKTGKKKLYNFLARFLIDKLPLPTEPLAHINLILDRCKNKEEIKDFNEYIENHLQGKLPLQTPLYISHESSQENYCLQAVDLFCWGIARHWRDKDGDWLKKYNSRVKCNELYLTQK